MKLPSDVRTALEGSKQGRWYLEHGQLLEVSQVRAGKWGIGKCHNNSRWLSRRWPNHYRWWTGYSIDAPIGGGFIIAMDNHSWVRHVDGGFIELTYKTPARLYLGVEVFGDLVDGGCRFISTCAFHPNECLAVHQAPLSVGVQGRSREDSNTYE